MSFLSKTFRVTAAVSTLGISEGVLHTKRSAGTSRYVNGKGAVEGGRGHFCGTPNIRGKRCRQMDGSIWTCGFCGQRWRGWYWESPAYSHLTWKKVRGYTK